jgi:hypothetical protein
MATIATGYNQTLVTTPTSPSTESFFDYDLNFPLYREIVKRDLVDEPVLKMELSSAESFFNGERMIDTSLLLSNLEFGQELIVKIRKDQNPFSLFQKEEIEYEANEGDSCHSHIVLDCTVPCINTLPTFEELRFRFDCEYAYGVRMCDKNKAFWTTEFFTRQYALSKRAYQFGREVDLWNKIIDGLVAAPATTVDAALAAAHPTHYWSNQGTVAANARCVVPEAVWYLKQSYANINPTAFITSEFATELIKSVETVYNLNFSNTRVNTFEQWLYPGYRLVDRVKEILGLDIPVVVLERSPWLTVGAGGSGSGAGSLTTQYPLWSADGEKQYVAILDPRVGYSFEKDGYHLNIKPYDCDKLYAGMIDTVYVGSGITFPQLGLIIEFDSFDYC